MSWDLGKIEATERAVVAERLGGATREELMEEVVALRRVLHPILYTLGSLDDRAPRGLNVTSKLFPAMLGEGEDSGKPSVWDPVAGDFRHVALASHELHLSEYEEAESLTVENGAGGETPLDDAVSVIAVHGHWIGAYAFGGEITMGDVRRAVAVMWPRRAGGAG